MQLKAVGAEENGLMVRRREFENTEVEVESEEENGVMAKLMAEVAMLEKYIVQFRDDNQVTKEIPSIKQENFMFMTFFLSSHLLLRVGE